MYNQHHLTKAQVLTTTEETTELLNYVVYGKYNEIAKILTFNKNLALIPGNIVDYAGRRIEKITSVQLAILLLDSLSLEFFTEYLTKDQIKDQISQLITEQLISKYGLLGSYQGLINKLNKYIKMYDDWWTEYVEQKRDYDWQDKVSKLKLTELAEYWCCQVGEEQLKLPSYIIKSFMHDVYLSFPYAKFKEQIDFSIEDWFYQGAYKLGKDFAWGKGELKWAEIWQFTGDPYDLFNSYGVMQDCKALKKLLKINKKQLGGFLLKYTEQKDLEILQNIDPGLFDYKLKLSPKL